MMSCAVIIMIARVVYSRDQSVFSLLSSGVGVPSLIPSLYISPTASLELRLLECTADSVIKVTDQYIYSVY